MGARAQETGSRKKGADEAGLMNPLKRLLPGDILVIKAISLLAVMDLVFTWLYEIAPQNLKGEVILQGVLWSMTTSVVACYYALKLSRQWANSEERIKRGIDKKIGTNVIQRMGDLAVKVDKKLGELTPEQRNTLMGYVERAVDFGLGALKQFSSDGKKPKRLVVKTVAVGKGEKGQMLQLRLGGPSRGLGHPKRVSKVRK